MRNLKNILTNGALMLLSVFALVFMSQAYSVVNLPAQMGGKQVTNGFDFIKNLDLLQSSNDKLIAASIILIIILASVLIVSAVLNMLISFDIIKNEKLAKILTIVNVVASVLVLVFFVCIVGALADEQADAVALMPMLKGLTSLGWGIIVNIVLAVIAVAVAVAQCVISYKK